MQIEFRGGCLMGFASHTPIQWRGAANNSEAGGSSLQAKNRFFLIPAFLFMALLIVSSLAGCCIQDKHLGAGVPGDPGPDGGGANWRCQQCQRSDRHRDRQYRDQRWYQSGRAVQAVYVDMGDHVSAGQALAQLDPADLNGNWHKRRPRFRSIFRKFQSPGHR